MKKKYTFYVNEKKHQLIADSEIHDLALIENACIDASGVKSIVNDTRRVEVINAKRIYFFLAVALTSKTLNTIANHLSHYNGHAMTYHHRKRMISLLEINDKETVEGLKCACKNLGVKYVAVA